MLLVILGWVFLSLPLILLCCRIVCAWHGFPYICFYCTSPAISVVLQPAHMHCIGLYTLPWITLPHALDGNLRHARFFSLGLYISYTLHLVRRRRHRELERAGTRFQFPTRARTRRPKNSGCI
ncbi:hypothetical protein L226DRAFT_343240 [Lentinus tigrinus ALCF2SS1-7]|uniref:uncharacterized protein n=1 Tax=Lentinus tigrinus ALCF2SS1-7 TaxID=1328758 RepID=UPI001165E21A|nr:hypothetical protein L226DRAFT_343240 [Lentinus tigrinus ALCF2SS1-7]